MAPSVRSRRSARRSRAGADGPRSFAPSSVCARRPGTPSGPPGDAALPSEQSGVDEIPPQRGVIGVHGLQHAIDLVLAVLAAGCEPARKVDEDGLAPLAPGGDRLETTIAEERRELGRAIACGVREIAVFASASESYSRKNLNQSRDAAIAGYEPVIARAKAAGVRVRGYLSMVVADPWDGPTPAPLVADLSRRLLDFGCDEISLGDTIGVGTPGEVTALLGALRRGNVPIAKVAFHFHDTYGQALANVLAAMAEGILTFDASVGGIGGSPFAKMAGGNLATEDLVWMCRGIGIETGVDLDKLVATSRWLGERLGRELPAHVSRAMSIPRS